MTAGRRAMAAVIGAVVRQAVSDAVARGLMVLEPETPDGAMVLEIAAAALGSDRVYPAPVHQASGDGDAADREWRRAAARIAARDSGLLLANPASKTELLLARWTPAEPLFPLGDLYASRVARLAGDVSVSPDVASLASAAGGLDIIDAALEEWLERRTPLHEAMAVIPEAARTAIIDRLRNNRAARRWPHRVPKLTERTLWIDIHE